MPSEKILLQKQQSVKELADHLQAAQSVVLADYRGLTVEQDTELRNALRKAGIDYKVVKNSITRFAVKDSNLSELESYLSGPTALAISTTDPVAPAKVLADFAKKFENLEIKAGVVEGKVIDINGVKALAALPSKEELVAKVVGGISSPLYGLVNVLNANLRGLVVALNAVAEQKAQA